MTYLFSKRLKICGLVKEAISFMTNNNNQVINHEYTSCVYSGSGKMTHAKCLPVLHIIDFPSDWNGSMEKLSLKCNDEASSLKHYSKMCIVRMSFRLVSSLDLRQWCWWFKMRNSEMQIDFPGICLKILFTS